MEESQFRGSKADNQRRDSGRWKRYIGAGMSCGYELEEAPAASTRMTVGVKRTQGQQGESRCCLLLRRRNRETMISGFAELSFRTEFRVQN